MQDTKPKSPVKDESFAIALVVAAGIYADTQNAVLAAVPLVLYILGLFGMRLNAQRLEVRREEAVLDATKDAPNSTLPPDMDDDEIAIAQTEDEGLEPLDGDE